MAAPTPLPVTRETARFPQHIRDGFRPMMPLHEDLLAQAMEAGKEIFILSDKSLGACVIAKSASGPVVAMIAGKSVTSEEPFWSFPKGHPDAGENDLDGAVREVREEVSLDIGTAIFPAINMEQNYTFTSRLHSDKWKEHASYPDEDRRPFVVYHKLVRYYLAVLPAPLPLVAQEAEVVEAAWVSINDAIARLPREDMREPFADFFARADVRAALV